MTTSGVTTNQLTRNQILEAAFGLLAVLAQGQTPSTDDYTIGANYLNMSVARARKAIGLPLWARASYSWVPTASSYTIGVGKTLDTPYPLHIIQAYRTTSSGARVPIDVEADYDFNLYPTAASSGVPLKITYTPAINYGTIKFWPVITTNTETVTIVYTRPVEYFSASTDTMDLPEEWTDAIVYDVATKLAPRWGIPIPDRRELKAEAKQYWDEAIGTGFEDASVYMRPYQRFEK